MQLLARGVASFVAVALVVTAAVAGGGNRYQESFKNYRYVDRSATTARWDTAAGEIRLPPFEPRVLGVTGVPGDVRSLTRHGYLVLAGETDKDLLVVDVRDPSAPVLLGSYAVGDVPFDVAAAANYAYVAAGTGGLRAVDISDPSSPHEVGHYATPGSARAVTLDGRTAYLCDFAAGVLVVDVSDPASPQGLGTCATGGFCQDIVVDGDFAYVAAGPSGLAVVDVSDRAAPELVGRYGAAVFAQAVALSGNVAFIANGQEGLVLVDVSDRTHPVLLAAHGTPDFARHVSACGAFALVSDISSGVLVFDVSQPSNPVLNGSLDTDGLSYAAEMDGPYAYLADGLGGVKTLQVGEALDPLPGGGSDTPGTATGIRVAGQFVYVADGVAGLHVLDVSVPASPVGRGVHDTPGFAAAVDVCGRYAYVADGTAGLRVVDVADPDAPALAASVDTPGDARGVEVMGEYVYVADGGAGLQVIDVVDPRVPSVVGAYDTPGIARDVCAAGTLVFVVDGGLGVSGVRVVDASDPAAPVLVANVACGGDAVAAALEGQYLFVLQADADLIVLDVTDPAAPEFAGWLGVSGEAFDIAVSGKRALVAGGSSGLRLIDVSDPATPALIGTSAACEDARSADVRGEYGFVADGASGVRAIQVANLSMNTTSDRVQSLAVNAGSDDVVSVRLQATMQDSIRWEASADGGLNWTEIAADGGWHTATTPGEDLRWRSNHVLTVAGVNPSCSSLEIEWLGAACVIDSAGDVPGDRGGWVRLVFSRSGYDVADAGAREITQYVIHRRMDRVAAARGGRARSDPYTVARVQGDPASFATMCPGAAAKGVVATGTGFPPGSWEVAGCVPALRQDTYVAVAPTVVDSVDTLSYTVFVVSAHTADPDVYFVSAPDSAFSVDNSGENIPPAAPTGFTVVRHVGGGNVLSWRANTEPDFLHYRVYRDTVESFPLNVSRRVCQTFETTWTDPVSDEQPSYYRLTAVDLLFNESAPAQAWVATGVRGQAPPGLALHRNFPNPFGPTTTIRFEVPLAGAVATMRVYDAAGRTIRTLFDGYQMGGAHAVVWDGRDDAGRPVPSGVYWCRLSGPGFVRSLKMTLVQ